MVSAVYFRRIEIFPIHIHISGYVRERKSVVTTAEYNTVPVKRTTFLVGKLSVRNLSLFCFVIIAEMYCCRSSLYCEGG